MNENAANEITTGTAEALHEAWPNVTYRGTEFFTAFYAALKSFEQEQDLLKEFDSHQECYVGYLPETDEFIVGWDAWTSESFEGCAQVFRYDAHRQQLYVRHGQQTVTFILGKGFYGGMLEHLHAKFPALKDLRLD